MNKEQAYYNLFVSQIEKGQFVLEEMLYKIEKRTAEGYFDEETRDNLRALAEKCVDPSYELEVTQAQKVVALEERADDLELAVMDLAAIISEIAGGAM